jgi:dolichol-phosphate mannosyltransferase
MANEATSAAGFVREVLAVIRASNFRDVVFLAILDRASTDGTRGILESLGLPELRVIYAPENRSVVDAYMRGYREALAHGADWILEMDAGYSHLPADIPRFLANAHEPWDCVIARRFGTDAKYLGGLSRRLLVSRVGGWLARLLLGQKLADPTSGFQLFSRRAMQEVTSRALLSRGAFFQTEIKWRLDGWRIKEVPITYVPTGQAARPAALWDAFRTLLRLFAQRIRKPAVDRHIP